MRLDLKGAGRYVEELSPEARESLDTALRDTVGFIVGLRNGAIYRYEDNIKAARDAVYESMTNRRAQ
jgi:hypothetical protein